MSRCLAGDLPVGSARELPQRSYHLDAQCHHGYLTLYAPGGTLKYSSNLLPQQGIGDLQQMGALLIDRTDILFIETLLIFSGLCAMSIISFLFLHGHFKVNTSFRGYTVQMVVLRTKVETFMSRTKLRRSISMRLRQHLR